MKPLRARASFAAAIALAAIIAWTAFPILAFAQAAGIQLPQAAGSVLQLAAGQLAVGQGVGSNPAAAALSGDCTLNSAGVITCTKTNGSSFGTAATVNTGTSGGTVPLLNTANTWAAGLLQSFSGHVASSGSAPSLSSCGGGSPAVAGDDKAGIVTMGTSATGCVITFNAAYTGVPSCVVTWQATPLASQSYTVTNAAITTVQTSTSSNKLNYRCDAPSGG